MIDAKKKQYRDEEIHQKKLLQKQEQEASFLRSRCQSKPEETKTMNIKLREKQKRLKGQSSQTTWKPELWMKIRQEYD